MQATRYPVPGLSLRDLTRDDAAALCAHLLALSDTDRSLRFAGALVTDASIERYAAGIRFDHDAVIGLTGAKGLVDLAHGALFSSAGAWLVEAAFSVDENWRGFGLGKWLMAAVQDFARQAGASEVAGMCLVRNLRMRRVFECAGMTLTREDGEVHAQGRLSCADALAAPAGLMRPGRVGKLSSQPVGLAL